MELKYHSSSSWWLIAETSLDWWLLWRCADLAAERRRQNVVVERVHLWLVPLQGRRSTARQQLPQQAFQSRHYRRQVSFCSNLQCLNFTLVKNVQYVTVIKQFTADQSFGHCFPPAPAFSQQPSSLRSTLPAQHVRPSGFFSFSVAGPTVWNSLPEDMRDPECSVDSYRQSHWRHFYFRSSLLVCSANLRFTTRMRYINSLLTFDTADYKTYELESLQLHVTAISINSAVQVEHRKCIVDAKKANRTACTTYGLAAEPNSRRCRFWKLAQELV